MFNKKLLSITALSLFTISCLADAVPKSVHPIATIDLPSKTGRADYLTIDGNTLFVGFTSENSVVMIDTKTNKVKGVISNLPRVHSAIAIPGKHIAYTSNGGDNSSSVIDLKKNKELKRLAAGTGPDAIIYLKKSNLVYVADHRGKTATLIDPTTYKTVGTIELGGTAEYAQEDPNSGLVYQNIEDTSEVVVVDTVKMKVTDRFKTAPGEEPSGLAYDARNHRVFSACGNNKLVVLDALTGKLIQELPIGGNVDFAVFDAKLKRIYTANGAGTMTVISQNDANHYSVLEEVTTFRGGHALAVDFSTHNIFVVHGGQVTVYAADKVHASR